MHGQMNSERKAIIEGLPDKAPRSRLEPYKEFIEELRRRGRTFRQAAVVAFLCLDGVGRRSEFLDAA
jgi:hypothetical protein